MTNAPSFDDIFAAMSAASVGNSLARVALPDDPRLDDTATKLAAALNLLLDDLEFRAASQQRELAESGRAAHRLQILSDAAHEFSRATYDYERLLDVVARRLAEALGDLCGIRMISEDGEWLEPTHAVYHADPEMLALARQGAVAGPQRVGEGISGRVAATGQAVLIGKFSASELSASAEPKYREFLERLGITTLLVVALTCRGKVLGVASLIRNSPEQPYDDRDLELVKSMAAHAALALGNARSYAAERAARDAAEAATDERKRAEAGRTRAEEALRKSEEQLRQTQKMEAVGRLAGGIAHDFNNLLSVILSNTQLVLGDMKPEDPLRVDIEEVYKAASRAAGLTRQLLTFSRQQVFNPKVVDLRQVLASMENMLRTLVGEDITLVSLGIDSIGRVKVDPTHIEQVILNLVVNARDAMPTGGKLTIETADVLLDENYTLGHLPANAGRHVMMSVSDTGIGMDRETQARIFEPFFTTKGIGKGSGMGLSMVFGIVQRSGGNVWVYSEPGKGATFKVYLPRVDDEVEPIKPQVALTTLRGSETVLLVEDEELVRATVLNILRRQGYRVVSASGAAEALLLCGAYPDKIDLLLTDVVMPQMSGPELAKLLTVTRTEMKVLCMSGYTDDTIVRHGMLETGVAYLQKPITPASLSTKVREVLDEAKGLVGADVALTHAGTFRAEP